MSEKYGNPCAIYNIPLNISTSDIFRIGCAHLYHFLHINSKTDNCKPMMLKMHLELDDHPPSSIGEAEERYIVHKNSNNGLRQFVEQLEEQINALKDVLLQAKEDVNRIDKAPDIKNTRNAMQESKSNKKANKFKKKNKLNGKHNNTENIAKASERHHTNTTITKKKQNVIDLRRNCVYIQNVQCSDADSDSDSTLEKAFCNVRKLANEMNAKIPDDSIINIDVEMKDNCLDYYVHFCRAASKEEFLKNRHFLKYHPETSPLRIFDYNEWGIVEIKDFRSSDLSLEAAYVNVMGIAERMGIPDDWNIRSSIDHMDVYVSTNPNFLNYSVRFNDNFHKNEFVRRKDKLKQFPETKFVEILDWGEHKLRLRNVNNVSVTVASANVIGLAELIGLSLVTDNFQRIYVLNYVPYYVDSSGLSFVVEFSSMEVKDEFLKRKHNLEKLTYFYSDIEISDINEKKNIVLIKYETGHLVTAFSFIGLAKQLGVSLTPDQIQNFFDLSEFTHLY